MSFNNPMIAKDKETILCAAIWYKEFTIGLYQPINIDKGCVISGWRHGSIIQSVKSLTGLRTVTKGENSTGEYIQGFLTSKNRFLNRAEARELFEQNGFQSEYTNELYSEDLY